MRALSVRPGAARSAALSDVAEPEETDGKVLVEPIAIGICGTDRDILSGLYGGAPPGRDRLVLGHECVGRVIEASRDSGFAVGDHVVPIVRQPDPVPCTCCLRGEWDMCSNGRFTERGIKGRDGFTCERFRVEPAFAVKIDAGLGELAVLLEPASVVAKAWEQIERIGERACFSPVRVLVTGAGPVGLLAALLAAQRGLEVHVVDRVRTGPKPELVKSLGARYHPDISSVKAECGNFDIALECTGAASIVLDVLCATGPNSITCLTGVSSGRRMINLDVAGLNRSIVLENAVVFGTVNANRRHYEAAAGALGAADRSWLSRLVTRRVPFADWQEGIAARGDDVKVVLVPD